MVIRRERGLAAAKMPEDASDLPVLARKKNPAMRVEICSRCCERGRKV
jgi:hypothetical protein